MKYFLRKSTLGLVSVSAAFLMASSVDQMQVQSDNKTETVTKEDNVEALQKQANELIEKIQSNYLNNFRKKHPNADELGSELYLTAWDLVTTSKKITNFP